MCVRNDGDILFVFYLAGPDTCQISSHQSSAHGPEKCLFLEIVLGDDDLPSCEG